MVSEYQVHTSEGREREIARDCNDTEVGAKRSTENGFEDHSEDE